LITSGDIKHIRPTAIDIGKAKRIDDAIGRYIVFCKNTFTEQVTLEGMKIVLDCANGATYKVAPIIFSELGAEVFTIHDEPNGININDNCGSQHTADLRRKVREVGADIGLAFDGDGDRLIAVDERGEELTGDHVIAICAAWYKQQGWLKNNKVVATVMSNFGFHEAMKRLDIEVAVAPVGDRYVLERMRADEAVLGGEASGHLIFANHHTTGDGIIAALQLLAVMKDRQVPLSELAGIMRMFPQRLINLDVASKPPIEEVPELMEAIRQAELQLHGSGRVLVRYSGTQSMCRVMVEGAEAELTERLARELAETVKRCIG
jgi:phosphoglucosamine mutase